MISNISPQFAGTLIVREPYGQSDTPLIQQHLKDARAKLQPYQKLVELLTPEGFSLEYNAIISKDGDEVYQSLSPDLKIGKMSMGGGDIAKRTPMHDVLANPNVLLGDDFHHWVSGKILAGYRNVTQAVVSAQKRLDSIAQSVRSAQGNLENALFNYFPDAEQTAFFNESFESGTDSQFAEDYQRAYSELGRFFGG